MRVVAALLIAWAISGLAAAQTVVPSAHRAAIAGAVRDDTSAMLPGATVTIRSEIGRVVATSTSDEQGRYRIDRLDGGTYSVEIALPNFATRRYAGLHVAAGQTHELDTTLVLTITADVTVTAKRTLRNLAELDSLDGGLLGIADSASEGLVTARQLDARPILRAGEILEAVPGLVISQHSGEGKANQYYLRGFNLDHGTDFATSIAGDFSTAGTSHVRYASVLDRPVVRFSVGADGWRRMVGAASPRVGNGHLLVAVERTHNDGPWVRPDDYEKLNAVMGFSHGNVRNGFSVNAMMYRGTWDSTDQAPARAVGANSRGRFGGD